MTKLNLMIFNLNPSHEFESNTCRLTYLAEESYTLYENLSASLKFMRKMGLPNIGNPILKLENEVLTLVYSVMQHQTNCELYCTLVTDNAIDSDLQMQLDSLYELTNVLSTTYYEYLERWGMMRDQQKNMVIESKKLSIPA